ncbi:MAG: DUF58 domain-containing protein [Armatimonadota bacterium]|nr:DUF58 domain-containing protein [Armatimonadota bacterium]
MPLLDSEFLRSLEQLSLLARRRVRGGTYGERRSFTLGRGVEFADYRSYQVGDDTRYVDWNVLSRLDRLFVKLFREEEDLDVHLIVDASASMRFGNPSKLDHARRLAAALGYVALANLDRVGAVFVRDGAGRALPPRRGRHHALHLFSFLESEGAHGGTSLAGAIRDYTQRTRRRGMAVLITDLFDLSGFEAPLKMLRYRRFETFLVQVLSDEEIAPALQGDLRLVDSETGDAVDVTADGVALEAFERARDAFFADVERFCFRHGIEYLRTTTSVPVRDLVLRYMRMGGLVR